MVDFRYYDTTSINNSDDTVSNTNAYNLAITRRCANECWGLCFGPDTTSCTGLQIIHPYYSEVIGTSGTNRPTWLGTDIEFKGHALNSKEMSVTTWIYTTALPELPSVAWLAAGNT